MNNLKMFCICIHDDILSKVKSLNYIPVGLGDEKYRGDWLRDNTGDNISQKNKFYGEHTFHYWLWKNKIETLENDKWIGFCAYRRFWLNENGKYFQKKFGDQVLNKIPKSWNNYDVILGDHTKVDQFKWSKVLKYGKLAFLRNPKSIMKSGRSIRFHFDMFHGNGILDTAIDQLNHNDREDFREYVKNKTSYNQGNMFICRSKLLMSDYYKTIFEWLFRCEKIFGFNLKGYGKIRIYAFLAERFLPYWFSKYSNYLEWPIIFSDLRNKSLKI